MTALVKKTVLVCIGDRRREVSFKVKEKGERRALEEAIYHTFSDVLPGTPGSTPSLIIQ